VQTLAEDELLAVACKFDRGFEMRIKPGGFMEEGDVMLAAYCKGKSTEDFSRQVNGAIILGAHRTPHPGHKLQPRSPCGNLPALASAKPERFHHGDEMPR